MLNLNILLLSLIFDNFILQHKQATKIKSKLNNFLNNKIIFELIFIKRQKLLNLTAKNTSIFINS